MSIGRSLFFAPLLSEPPSQLLIVEVDGPNHKRSKTDKRRDRVLAWHGFSTLRLHNEFVLNDLEGAKAVILEMIERRAARTGRPSQTPAERRFGKKVERYLQRKKQASLKLPGARGAVDCRSVAVGGFA